MSWGFFAFQVPLPDCGWKSIPTVRKARQNSNVIRRDMTRRVGIFRVPFVDPDADVLAAVDVDRDSAERGRAAVTFGAAQVPREEDFYQFQYIRDHFTTDNRGRREVLGASIPFQLRKPKSEELCAVQQVLYSLIYVNCLTLGTKILN